MDVNEETQIETKKRSVWVLTRSHDNCDEQGGYTEAVFMERPSLLQLARHFQAKGDKTRHACAVSTLVFHGHLLNGGDHQGAEDCWYALEEVTES